MFSSYLQTHTTYTCYAYSRYNCKFFSISNTLLDFSKINLCVSTYHLSNYFNFHTQILMFFFSKSAFFFKSYNLGNYIKIKYYLSCFSCSTATHSTCPVHGNMSQIANFFNSYFSSKTFKSRAKVAGLQLTYTILPG